MQVALCHVVLSGPEPVVASCEKDTLALTASFWLYYKCFCFPLVKLFLESLQVTR